MSERDTDVLLVEDNPEDVETRVGPAAKLPLNAAKTPYEDCGLGTISVCYAYG